MLWKLLLIILAVVWFVGLVVRATFSRWLRRRTEEYNRAAKEAQKEAQRQARRSREGDVTVEAAGTATAKKVSERVGEYVEFEEITVATERGDAPKR